MIVGESVAMRMFHEIDLAVHLVDFRTGQVKVRDKLKLRSK